MIRLELNLELLGYPVIKDNSLEAHSQIAWVADKALTIKHVCLGVAARAGKVFNHRVGKGCIQTGIKRDWCTLLAVGGDWDMKMQGLILDTVVLDSIARLAL